MKFNEAIKLSVSIIICELAGVIGAIFTTPEISGWYVGLKKPFFNPPSWIFGPVWTILFVLMGVSLYLVWQKKFEIKNQIYNSNKKAWNKWSEKLWTGSWKKINIIIIFCVQLLLNILWSIIFFRMHNLGFAFFELLILWVAIIYTMLNFYRVSKTSSYLLIPYFLWVSFAGILNFAIWMIN
jgi:tryptophan-rich sensory protein